MNKLMKYSCFAIMALSALTFTACTEDYDYDPYTNVENSVFTLQKPVTEHCSIQRITRVSL